MKLQKSVKYGIIATIAAMALSSVYIFRLVNREIEFYRNEVMLLLENQASNLKTELLLTMEQTYELRAFIFGAEDNLAGVDLAAEKILKDPTVRNVLLAPGGVVEKVIPLEGNEAVVGLDLLSSSNSSYKSAIIAKETGELTVCGPYELKQGGQALSGRLAVYFPREGEDKLFWGIVSLTVDFPKVVEKKGLEYLDKAGYSYALSQAGEDGNFNIILDRRLSPEEELADVYFSVGNMDFALSAAPKTGWLDKSNIWSKALTFLGVSIAVGVLFSIIFQIRQKRIEDSRTDALTGALNRAGGTKKTNKVLHSGEYKYGAFMLLDIDFFKNVNDTLGHQTGDSVLVETASILKQFCRSNDIVCRLGGDEFFLYFGYDGNSDFVLEKAEEIRQRLQRQISSANKTVNISCSIGIAFTKGDSKNFSKLYEQADEALYKSKEKGRNAVTVHESGLPENE